MNKITFLGAGSTVFAKNVLGDCITTDAMREFEYALYDINPQRLEESYMMLSNINRNSNNGKGRVVKYTDRLEALRGAKYVINCIQVGGYDPCTITDFEIPKKYGIRQTIGDTHGIGGMFRALRTIPVMMDFTRDIEKVCPNALFINYTNPMSMLCLAMFRGSAIETVGLCHSHQVCVPQLLAELDLPSDGVAYKISGINHMAWLLEITRNGEDYYPAIRKRALENPICDPVPIIYGSYLSENYVPKVYTVDDHPDMVRFEMMKQFGYFVTESSEHFSEYVPYFIKKAQPELIDQFNIPLDEYPRRCRDQIARWKAQAEHLVHNENLTHKRSNEYAADIIQALETGGTFGFAGNVCNTGLIDNLPNDACVEVSCLVNEGHIHPCHMGPLPRQLAALNMRQIEVQQLTVDAALTGKKDCIYQAAMLDPRLGSELTMDEIHSLVDDLIEAHGDWLPQYH